MKNRTIVFYKDYFEKFFIQLRPSLKNKIVWTLQLIEELEVIPNKFLKYLENTNGLYEIRVFHLRNSYRIFCFFDDGNLIVLTTGFHKKTRKTPKKELDRAARIKKEYEHEKQDTHT